MSSCVKAEVGVFAVGGLGRPSFSCGYGNINKIFPRRSEACFDSEIVRCRLFDIKKKV